MSQKVLRDQMNYHNLCSDPYEEIVNVLLSMNNETDLTNLVGKLRWATIVITYQRFLVDH